MGDVFLIVSFCLDVDIFFFLSFFFVEIFCFVFVCSF